LELATDVSDVRLDGLWTEKEHVGDLGIRPAVDDEPRDLQLTLRQGRDATLIALTGSRAAVDAMAEASQFPLGRGAVSERAAGV
jgi:hypothetical protein